MTQARNTEISARTGDRRALLLGGAILLVGLASFASGPETHLTLPLLPMLFLFAAVRIGQGRSNREIRGGAILIAVGIWLLVSTLGLFGLDHGDSWPLLLILIGIVLTLLPDGCGRRSSGLVLIGWGALCWIAVHRLWGFSWANIWPLIIVLVGIGIIRSALSEQKRQRTATSEAQDD